MSKYADIALEAAALAARGTPPPEAWEACAARAFPTQTASRDKGCPKGAFLGLASSGIIAGVPGGNWTRSRLNRQ